MLDDVSRMTMNGGTRVDLPFSAEEWQGKLEQADRIYFNYCAVLMSAKIRAICVPGSGGVSQIYGYQ